MENLEILLATDTANMSLLQAKILTLNKNTEETLDGFIFSLFSMIDGESGSNDFHHLIIKDKGTILNNDNYLHELWVGYCEEENKK